ncbi:MAG TPA: glycerate kinase [Candidatus Obscuribacterales bacterium]
MQIVVAPCAYKGTFSPSEAAEAIKEGVQIAFPQSEIVLVPIADGGDGTVEAIHLARGGSLETLTVHGALGEEQEAHWLALGAVAIAELASASGIARLSGAPLRPLEAHTRGLGEVIRECIEKRGFARVVVAVGGSASTDGGTGALTALGARFLDSSGKQLAPGGGELRKLAAADLSALTKIAQSVSIAVAVDVVNPLLGSSGAARVFGPQKGAGEEDIRILEEGLGKLKEVLESATGRMVADAPGAGAAGGTAFGLCCCLGAKIMPGFEWIAGILRLEQQVKCADIVITGEGRLDEQSMQGKGVGELVRLCEKFGRPLIAVPAIASSVSFPGIYKVVPAARMGEGATYGDIARAAAAALDEVKRDICRGHGLSS